MGLWILNSYFLYYKIDNFCDIFEMVICRKAMKEDRVGDGG